MKKSLIFVFAICCLILLSFWLVPRKAGTQTIVRQSVIRDQNGRATFIYSRALARYVPVNDRRSEIAEISRNTPRDKKHEKAFLESKKALLVANPTLTDEQKRSGIQRIEEIISRLGFDDVSPLPEPRKNAHGRIPIRSDNRRSADSSQDQSPPGGIGFGIAYVNLR